MPHWKSAICMLTVVVTAACTDNDRSDIRSGPIVANPAVREWLGNSAAMTVTSEVGADYNVAPVASMISGLETRLESEPEDLQGWSLLAQSYAYVGDMSKAQVSADRAIELGIDADEMQERLIRAHARSTP